MKKTYIFLLVLMITGNLFVFGYGIYSFYGAVEHETELRHKLAADSCIVLATHAYEDRNMDLFSLEGLDIDGIKCGFMIDISDKHIKTISVHTGRIEKKYIIKR